VWVLVGAVSVFPFLVRLLVLAVVCRLVVVLCSLVLLEPVLSWKVVVLLVLGQNEGHLERVTVVIRIHYSETVVLLLEVIEVQEWVSSLMVWEVKGVEDEE
jgi:hypothetical protein